MKRTLIITTTFAVAASAGLLVAGPLNPPAGPVAPTYKTLSEFEPRTPISAATTPGDADSVFRITQPGSYYLTAGFTVPGNFHGIEIAADNVTVDLSGFTLTGAAGSLEGVTVASTPRRRVAVRNGSLRSLETGVRLDVHLVTPSEAMLSSFDGLKVSNCALFGIYAYDGIARDCQVSGCSTGLRFVADFPSLAEGCCVAACTFLGLSVTNGTIAGCAASDIDGTGISIGNTGVISDCSAEGCDAGFGGSYYTITGCTARNNTYGIYTNARATIVGNTVTSASLTTGTVGISAGLDGTRIERNNITFQAIGIRVNDPGNFVASNTIRSCPTAVNAVANNRVGALIIGALSPAINGNSGGGLGTTDPYANIIY